MAGKAFTHYDGDRKSCYQIYANDRPSLESCLSHSEKEFRSGLYSGFHFSWDDGEFWSFKGYYRHMGWLLPAAIVLPPLLVYLLAWGVSAICLWIWRGFRREATRARAR
jgi:hypothetical protein